MGAYRENAGTMHDVGGPMEDPTEAAPEESRDSGITAGGRAGRVGEYNTRT
jgi:hypothetical protein